MRVVFIILSFVSALAYSQSLNEDSLLSNYKLKESSINFFEKEHMLLSIDSMVTSNSTFFYVKNELMKIYSSKYFNKFNLQSESIFARIGSLKSEYDDSTLAEVYLNIGNGQLFQGAYSVSLKNILIADSINKRINNRDLGIKIKESLAFYYGFLGYLNKSLDLHLEVLEYSLLKFDSYQTSISSINVGKMFRELGKYKFALDFLNKSMNGLDSNSVHFPQIYYEFAKVYEEMGDYNLSKENYWCLLSLIDREYNSFLQQKVYLDLANLYINLGRRDSSLYYLNKYAANSYSNNHIENRVDYYSLRLLLDDIADSSSSYYFKKYKESVDSLAKSWNKIESNKLLFKYENSIRENKIKQLKFDKNIKYDKIERLSLENQVAKGWYRFLIVLVILILVVTFFIIKRIKWREKTALQTAEIELEKSKNLKQTILIKNQEIKNQIEKIGASQSFIEELETKLNKNDYIDLITNKLSQSYISDYDWDELIIKFDQSNDFKLKKLQEENSLITQNDLKLVLLEELGFTIKSVAEILKITEGSVRKAKQRLSKKVK